MVKMSKSLSDSDLIFISKILMPNYKNKDKILKILRQDDEIVEKMLSDERLFKYLASNRDQYINISPLLLFAILLRNLKKELESSSYTQENNSRYSIPIFDSKNILEFLNKENMLNYLAEMLASFTRIHSYSTMYKVRKGIWRRLKLNDFDIDSLVRYSRNIDERLRFRPFKKIADICLFILGIFPEYIETHDWPLAFGDRKLASLPEIRKIGFENYGKYYYKTAAEMDTAYALGLHRTLEDLSENFILAEKTLRNLTIRYLKFQKTNLFPSP